MNIRSILALVLLALFATPALGQSPQGDMTVRELFAIMNERERANNQRFDAQEKAVAAALAAAKEAVIKAELAAEKRFESVNEFRNTLKDQQQTLLPRTEADVRLKNIESRINSIEISQSTAAGKQEGINWLWSILVGLTGLAIGSLMAILTYRSRRPSNLPDV